MTNARGDINSGDEPGPDGARLEETNQSIHYSGIPTAEYD